MKTSGGRPQRFAEEMQRALADILRRDVGDPRLALLTVTEVDVSKDLSNATIRVSHLNPQANVDDVMEALQKAAPHIRHQLSRQVHARRIPQLHFVADHLQEQAFALEAKLRAVRPAAADEDHEPE